MILPLHCGLYGVEYSFLSTPNSFATLENKSFFNLVPFSISSVLQTPNGKAIRFLQAVTISSADLFLIEIENVYPVNIQTAVNAYLLLWMMEVGIHQLGPY